MEGINEATVREIITRVIRLLKAQEDAIPVGVSNRHLHLSENDFESLFGPNRQLTKIKDLTQPGEFASAETVSLIGPKGMIRDVRVLGPFRKKTQVEISKSDAFALGVKAPIRESGKTDGTPGIVIEGPKGRISIENGLIAALRHIHMDPESAKRIGVKNSDLVSVRAEGERALVFDNVLVRVSERYKPEIHIDTDEANAADLKSGDFVRITKIGNKAIAIITGGTGGFDEAAVQMKKLREDGWNIEILFTAGAARLYSKEYLEEKFEGFAICSENENGNRDFLVENRMVLIPVLTVNTLVKIALGIADTPATHLISSALIGGIPVIAAKDACDTGNSLRGHFRNEAGSDAYLRKLEMYAKTAGEYGVTLVACSELSETVRAAGNKSCVAESGGKKRIITKEDVVRAKQNGSMKIVVGSSAKITPYAKEIAGELGVEILCISQT